MSRTLTPLLLAPFLFFTNLLVGQDSTTLKLAATINGKLSPKSIVHSGNGLFFAQNMMYKHKITVYDRNYKLVKTIKDDIDLAYCGFKEHKGMFQGSPVEAAFSNSGSVIWVSNYQMYGDGFDNPGTDGCRIADVYDSSFVYRVNVDNYDIDAAIKVGSIPKYIAVTPNDKYILVSNWCSGDLSIISNTWNEEIKRIKLGKYPRGIVVDKNSEYAYVAIMGDTRIAKVNLNSSKITWIENVGKKPRHLCIDSKSQYLYATINSENKIQKIDLITNEVVATARTQKTPRSMVLADNDLDLFVVNYNSSTMSHIKTDQMKIIQSVPTDHHPIGITYDNKTKDVWVACYSGSIKIYNQIDINTTPPQEYIAEVEVPITVDETAFIDEDIPEVIAEIEEPQSNNGKYHIVVGAFGDPSNVQKMLDRCTKKGFSPYIINPGSKVQKISCKNFQSRAQAQKDLEDIQNAIEIGAWILKY